MLFNTQFRIQIFIIVKNLFVIVLFESESKQEFKQCVYTLYVLVSCYLAFLLVKESVTFFSLRTNGLFLL